MVCDFKYMLCGLNIFNEVFFVVRYKVVERKCLRLLLDIRRLNFLFLESNLILNGIFMVYIFIFLMFFNLDCLFIVEYCLIFFMKVFVDLI